MQTVEFYETFSGDEYCICILDTNQYKQDLPDFDIGVSQDSDGDVL